MEDRCEALVLGIGNVLWADEGFGVRAVEALHAAWAFPPGVVLQDGGTLGLALYEHLLLDERGIPRNASSLDYRIPTAMDVPGEIRSVFIENGDGPGPGGEKGIGEGSILAIAPAVAEAVRGCIGVEMREIPFTPERVWKAMSSKSEATM